MTVTDNPFLALLEPEEPKRLFEGRTLHKFRVQTEDGPCCSEMEYCVHENEAVEPHEADLVSSVLKDRKHLHKPVIDLDLPARITESGTSGHYHLWIDMEVPWDKYVALLEALADAGIVQPGYVKASKARGYSSVRVPWKPKGVVA